MGGENQSRAPSSYPKLAERPVGQHIKNIYIERLRQFTAGGQYQGQNLVEYALFFFSLSPRLSPVIPSG